MTVLTDSLPDDPGTLKAMLIAERVQNERLRQIIKELQRHRFGRRAETLPEDQMLLGLEEVEQVAASNEAETEAGRAGQSCRQASDQPWVTSCSSAAHRSGGRHRGSCLSVLRQRFAPDRRGRQR